MADDDPAHPEPPGADAARSGSGDPNPPDPDARTEGSRVDQRDVDGVRDEELDPRFTSADSPEGWSDPDEWFAETFPNGEGFASWLERHNVWDHVAIPPDTGVNRYTFTGAARRRPDLGWQLFEAKGKRLVQAIYMASLLGDDSSAVPWRYVDEIRSESPEGGWLVPEYWDKTALPEGAEPPEVRPTGFAAGADEYATMITLPDGSQITERHDVQGGTSTAQLQDREKREVETEQLLEDYESSDGARTASTAGGAGISRRIVIGAGSAFAAAVAAGLILFGGGDSDGTGGSGGDSEASGSSSSSAAAAGAAAVAATTEGGACSTIRGQQLVLDFSSPDVQPTIPLFFAKGTRDENDFPSPQLDWSAVPPETLEIVVLVMSLLDERADRYRADADLWWDGVTPDNISGIPIGRVRWTLSGIDATTRSLAGTSLSSPPPPGTTEHFNSGTGTTRGTGSARVDLDNKFIGPDRSGEWYLFTIFALCDPFEDGPEPDEWSAGWFKRHSIATGWFFAQASW